MPVGLLFYYLRYDLEQRGLENGFAQIGSFMHKILENLAREELEEFELVEYFEEHFTEWVPEGVSLITETGFVMDLTEKYKAQCIEFLRNVTWLRGYKIIGVEEEFLLFVETPKAHRLFFHGFIDLVLEDTNGDIIIADWKSKSKFKSPTEVKQYARQLYLYSIYIERKYGKMPKELRFLQFRIDHQEKIKFSVSGLEEALNWVDDRLDSIETQLFAEAKPNKFYCANLCDYRDGCEFNN